MSIWKQWLVKDRQSRCRNINKRLKIERNYWFRFFLTWMSRCYKIMWKITQLSKISGKTKTLIIKWITCRLVNLPWSHNLRSWTSRSSWANSKTPFYVLNRTSLQFWQSRSWSKSLFCFFRGFHRVVCLSSTKRHLPSILTVIGGFTWQLIRTSQLSLLSTSNCYRTWWRRAATSYISKSS